MNTGNDIFGTQVSQRLTSERPFDMDDTSKIPRHQIGFSRMIFLPQIRTTVQYAEQFLTVSFGILRLSLLLLW